MKRILILIAFIFLGLKGYTQSLQSYIPRTGLIAWYSFSGNANDNSGHGYNGAVTDAILTSDRFGNTNSAYLFNGSSSSIATMLQPPSGNAARTLACWFKYNALPNPCRDEALCIMGYGGNNRGCGQACKNFSMEISYGPPRVRVDGICIANSAQGRDSLDNNWHFFAAVYEPSFGGFQNIKIYQDGAYLSTLTAVYGGTTSVITDTLSKFEIGAGHYDCRRFFDGKIDDIGIWNRALTESELYTLYTGVPTAESDSLLVYANNFCTSVGFTVAMRHPSPSMSLKTWFGDGQSQTDTFSARTGFARFTHNYSLSGRYKIRHVLYDGATPIDSATYHYNYQYCRTLPVAIYYEQNFNCRYDTSFEALSQQPVTIEVDSAGTPIDTISATSGYDYFAYGPSGTAYRFKLITLPPGLAFACPATGSISENLQEANNPIALFGLSCDADPGYDLQVFSSFRAGSHHFGGTALANNTYCTPPAATLTIELSPKYADQLQFTPAPTSITGNIVKWNINTLSSVLGKPFLVHVDMETRSGVRLTPGDTVITRIGIAPDSSDANPGDNNEVRNDTVKNSYDPNDIAVSPSKCIPSGTNTLTYTIHFENTGNDTAYNVYVLDTLPQELDAKSLRIAAASAAMITSIHQSGSSTIVKFDFPNIKLLDSSHHGLNEGMLVYTINLKDGTPDNYISNRAGIYFDDNDVILTNTASVQQAVTPTVSVAPGTSQLCQGMPATFTTAATNAGSAPTYQWKVNNRPVGINAPSYTYLPRNADLVSATLISNAGCLSTNTASDSMRLVILPSIIPTVTIEERPGTRNSMGMIDTLVAIVDNGGPSPTYQWIVNSSVVPGATSAAYISTGLAAGDSVTCMVVGSNVCGNWTNFNSVFLHYALGLNHLSQSRGIAISPNPASIILNIAASPTNYSAYTLHDAMGQEIMTNSITTPTTVIDIKNLPAGVYTITLKGAAGAKVEKWVKW